MSRIGLISVSALALFAVGSIWTAPKASAQMFVGTPMPAQFTGQGQPSTTKGEWPTNAGDIRGTRYSPLAQIDASNFNKLQIAWRFKTDAFGPYPEWKLEGTPIMIKGLRRDQNIPSDIFRYRTRKSFAIKFRSTKR